MATGALIFLLLALNACSEGFRDYYQQSKSRRHFYYYNDNGEKISTGKNTDGARHDCTYLNEKYEIPFEECEDTLSSYYSTIGHHYSPEELSRLFVLSKFEGYMHLPENIPPQCIQIKRQPVFDTECQLPPYCGTVEATVISHGWFVTTMLCYGVGAQYSKTQFGEQVSPDLATMFALQKVEAHEKRACRISVDMLNKYLMTIKTSQDGLVTSQLVPYYYRNFNAIVEEGKLKLPSVVQSENRFCVPTLQDTESVTHAFPKFRGYVVTGNEWTRALESFPCFANKKTNDWTDPTIHPFEINNDTMHGWRIFDATLDYVVADTKNAIGCNALTSTTALFSGITYYLQTVIGNLLYSIGYQLWIWFYSLLTYAYSCFKWLNSHLLVAEWLWAYFIVLVWSRKPQFSLILIMMLMLVFPVYREQATVYRHVHDPNMPTGITPHYKSTIKSQARASTIGLRH